MFLGGFMSVPLSLALAQSVRKRYTPGMMVWHYEHGHVLLASLIAAEEHGDETIYPWVYSMYDRLICSDGTIATYRQGEYNLDMINAGRALFTLARVSGEERFSKAAEALHRQLESQPRCKNGVYWHKEIYPWQIWLDGLYMEGPFKAEYASVNGCAADFEDIVNQIIIVNDVMRDPKTGLLYHCFDESRGMKWSDDITGLSPHFWSRSIGWYMMAIIDVLDFLPQSQSGRDKLLSILRNLVDSVLKFQSEGMWYQVTDQGGREGNYLETSASSMFAYSILKGVRLGYLDPQLKERGLEAVKAIRERYLTERDGELHLGGICSVAGLGGNPYRDGTYRYYISEKVVEDDFKGVGSYILACTEEER